MARITTIFVLVLAAAFVAGCSFSLYMKILPEREQSTTETSSLERGADET